MGEAALGSVISRMFNDPFDAYGCLSTVHFMSIEFACVGDKKKKKNVGPQLLTFVTH